MRIVSVASAVPETRVANNVVEAQLGRAPGWIERRTGILERPTAADHEATSDLAIRAGARAMEQSGIRAEDISLLLLATSTPDHLLPPTAPLVASRLGLRNAGASDLAGACAGFLYAMTLGSAYGQAARKPVLIVAANVLTRRVNKLDAGTAALFSDGAGAVLLTPTDSSHFIGSYMGSDGALYDTIGIRAGGAREPITHAGLEEGRNLMTMRRGSALFRQAVHAMDHAGKCAMEDAGVKPEAIKWWIPHQANARITRETGNLLGIPPERTIDVIAHFGNSSAATIPIALASANEAGKLRSGDLLLLTAAGAGLLSAGLVVRW
jgi:3-oxoacyl-[acyl-carrier-protein] synthase III